MSWPNVKREDRIASPWNSFMPRKTYKADLHGCRAIMLETIAAIPDMMGQMLLHLKFLLIAGNQCFHANYYQQFNNEHVNMANFLVLTVPYNKGKLLGLQSIRQIISISLGRKRARKYSMQVISMITVV
ncbi:hypothetical protein NE237_001442 [Protea cynaroides]|uniref:Ubiquinol oxidase n=1 Tax=Protea cynaroides TaxID=273540 RepID=A0A9Q0KU00_9MAGN|nr:hypothetical protein NE237_001442 [Protea cynaroides]